MAFDQGPFTWLAAQP